jgi:hypothetical protein
VGNGDNLFEILDTEFFHRCEVVREDRLERLRLPPLRMLRRHHNDLIDGEGHLRIDWLLDPERAIVIKSREAVFGLNKIRRTFSCYALDKGNDRLLRPCIVP